MNYQELFPNKSFDPSLLETHRQKQKWVNQEKKGFLRYRNPYLQLSNFLASHVDFSGDTVIIGNPEEVTATEKNQIESCLRQFMPWRKGPFSVFGVDIDAEWQSQKKWQRLLPHLPNLKDKVICDVGCNNGYYMFRMLQHSPRILLGLEPSVQHYYCCKSLYSMAGIQNLHIDLLGVEHIGAFPQCFDVVFLMGIIYHRASPIDVLRDIFTSLAPGGTLVMESQAIPGDTPTALFPEKTYAKVPGTYFVPTAKCMENWMMRAGFSNIKLISSTPMSSAEQRKTDWMVFESYDDFIDQNNPHLTVEGYPAPLRVIVSGNK